MFDQASRIQKYLFWKVKCLIKLLKLNKRYRVIAEVFHKLKHFWSIVKYKVLFKYWLKCFLN